MLALRTSFSRGAAALRSMCTAAVKPEQPQGYAPIMKWLHWTMAGSAITCIVTVQLQQATKDPEEKGKWMFIHKSSGLLTGMLAVPRIIARVGTRMPADLPGPTLQKIVANLNHLALYGVIVGMPVSGIIMGYFGGKGLPFFFTTIPGAPEDQRDGALAKRAYLLHKQAGKVFEYGILPAHLGGVAVHLLKRDKILRRMNPFV